MHAAQHHPPLCRPQSRKRFSREGGGPGGTIDSRYEENPPASALWTAPPDTTPP